jgi:hypothetical protein
LKEAESLLLDVKLTQNSFDIGAQLSQHILQAAENFVRDIEIKKLVP